MWIFCGCVLRVCMSAFVCGVYGRPVPLRDFWHVQRKFHGWRLRSLSTSSFNIIIVFTLFMYLFFISQFSPACSRILALRGCFRVYISVGVTGGDSKSFHIFCCCRIVSCNLLFLVTSFYPRLCGCSLHADVFFVLLPASYCARLYL